MKKEKTVNHAAHAGRARAGRAYRKRSQGARSTDREGATHRQALLLRKYMLRAGVERGFDCCKRVGRYPEIGVK
jgi:hypothetical protein